MSTATLTTRGLQEASQMTTVPFVHTQMPAKEKAVGVLLVSDFPHFLGLTAFLQVRGKKNRQGNLQSYPGGCQVTVHTNKVHSWNTLIGAAKKAIHEELGKDFYCQFERWLKSYNDFKLVIKEFHRGNREITTYVVKIPFRFVDQMRPHWTSAGIRMLHVDDISSIQDLTVFDKQQGVADRNTIAMFPDEVRVVERVLSWPEQYWPIS